MTFTIAAPHYPRFSPHNPAGTRVAAVMHVGKTHPQLADTLTGYGRDEGYDSLANARRAAYMLTRGPDRTAAGIYRQGERFYVRAMGALDAAGGALRLTHFEGDTKAHIRHIQDPRLLMLVDGATKLFAKDAHHKWPTPA
jgi:hypothetical protein